MDDSFSAVAEDLFFSFSAFRPWPKCFFYCFSPVGRGRKSFFGVFGSSATAETQNLPVFDFPPRLKTNFRRFLDFIHGYECFLRFLRFAYERNAVFSVFRSSLASETLFFGNFYVSLMSEMLFSMFFARRLQAKRCFWQFLHFATSDE